MNVQEKIRGVGVPGFDRSTTWITGTAFTLASIVLYGNAQLSAYGFDLSALLNSAALSVGQLSIPWASFVALGGIVGAYLGNNKNLTDFSDHQTTLGMITAMLVIISAVSSDFTALVSGGMPGILFTAVLLIGYVSMVEIPEMEVTQR